jgi:hypothetical protein
VFAMTDDDFQSFSFQFVGKFALIGIDADNIGISQIVQHPCYT